ncbi:MAG TPA: hypothetical protein VFF37_14490 [Streptomyces sp.]|nr:hypothetical protein [Streptomyces sp.]
MTARRPLVGRRGEALLFFALLDAVYCFGLLTPPRPLTGQLAWMQGLLPLWVWAAAWGLVGALCLIFAFTPRRDTVAFTGAVAIKVTWGLLSLFGWMAGAVDRGYISAVVWLVFAYFVFRVAGGIPPPWRPDGDHAWTR